MTMEGTYASPGCLQKVGFDDNNRFEVYFNSQNRVIAVHERADFTQKPPPSVWERVLQLLGIREKKVRL